MPQTETSITKIKKLIPSEADMFVLRRVSFVEYAGSVEAIVSSM